MPPKRRAGTLGRSASQHRPRVKILPIPGNYLTLREDMRESGQAAITVVFRRENGLVRNILGHLNLQDVRSVASTDRGTYTEVTRADTIQSLPGQGCEEQTRGGRTNPHHGPCPYALSPHARSLMRLCGGNHVAPTVNSRQHNPGYVCQACKATTHIRNLGAEYDMVRANWLGLCTGCVRLEMGFYPDGINTCTCEGAMQTGWKCYQCRYAAWDQIQNAAVAQRNTLRRSYIDHNQYLSNHLVVADAGDPYWPRNTPFPLPNNRPACRCGKHHTNHHNLRVRMCFGCRGLIVSPEVTESTTPGVSRRRSARIATTHAEKFRRGKDYKLERRSNSFRYTPLEKDKGYKADKAS